MAVVVELMQAVLVVAVEADQVKLGR